MLRDLLGQAYSALRHNRRRSALTMLGMAWGIATVVILLAYGAGFERAIILIFRAWGTNMIMAFPGRTSLQAGGTKAGTEVRLKLEDVEHIANEVPMVKGASPMVEKRANVQYDTRTLQFRVTGVYPVFQRIRRMEVEYGRQFNELDELEHGRVAVIGDEVKKKLFSGRYALDNSIRIDGVSFQVIGILRHKVQDGDNNDNQLIMVPFSTMGGLKDTRYLDGIFLDYEGEDNRKVARVVRSVLATHHSFKPDDKRAVFIADLKEDLDEFRIITAGLKVLLTFIGTLTLGIGGVGLMNIMLVSVQQRTREIGVEKALGARKRHILFQFLAEALTITLLGGLCGIVLAYLISWTVGSVPLFSALAENAEEADIHLRISAFSLMVSTIILAVVGLVSGMLPAIRAARLDPIEALHYE